MQRGENRFNNNRQFRPSRSEAAAMTNYKVANRTARSRDLGGLHGGSRSAADDRSESQRDAPGAAVANPRDGVELTGGDFVGPLRASLAGEDQE